MYTALTWYDPKTNRPIEEPGAAYGVFFQNTVDESLDGWLCEYAPQSQYGWLCSSYWIPAYAFKEDANRLPIDKERTSWWECGCENMQTYTQAFCREPLVGFNEQVDTQRLRYYKNSRGTLWTVRQTQDDLTWTNVFQSQNNKEGFVNLQGAFSPLATLSVATLAAAVTLVLM